MLLITVNFRVRSLVFATFAIATALLLFGALLLVPATYKSLLTSSTAAHAAGTGPSEALGVSAVSAPRPHLPQVNSNYAITDNGAMGATATPTPECGLTWRLVYSPSPGQQFSSLYGVAAVAADDVWAVGYYTSTGRYRTL